METSFLSQSEAREAMAAEEWVNRVHDDKFNYVGMANQRYQVHLASPGDFEGPGPWVDGMRS